MMLKSRLLWASIVAILWSPSFVSADLILTLEQKVTTANAGDVPILIFASADAGTPTLGGFNLGLDLRSFSSTSLPGSGDIALPTNISFAAVPVTALAGGTLGPLDGTGINASAPIQAMTGADALVNLDFSNPGLSTTPKAIGSVNFNVGNAAPGRYWITLANGAEPFTSMTFSNSLGPTPAVQFNAGYLEISAVPEPSTVILSSLGLGAVLMFARYQWKRRKPTKTVGAPLAVS